MKDKLRLLGTIIAMVIPGVFFVYYPRIDSNLGLLIFLVLFFISVIETFKTIKYFHEK